jgi:hypothetical protein
LSSRGYVIEYCIAFQTYEEEKKNPNPRRSFLGVQSGEQTAQTAKVELFATKPAEIHASGFD